MSTPYIYPAQLCDNAQQLQGTLGSFWNAAYQGSDQVAAYVGAKAGVDAQSQLDLAETAAAISRYTVPVFHCENWTQLTLHASQKNMAQTTMLRYDNHGLYDSGNIYDAPISRQDSAYPVPTTLMRAPALCDQLRQPALLWIHGLDYILDPDTSSLVFRVDPFNDPRISATPVFVNSTVVDQTVTLWIFRGEFDLQYLYQQFGYVVSMQLPSSPAYRDLLNAAFDSVVGGSAMQQLLQALSAVTDIPVSIAASEIVEDISVDPNGRLILTDQTVYRSSLASLPLVAIGDVITAGTPLVDSLEVFNFQSGALPADLNALAIGKNMISLCLYGDLLFENKTVPLEVITDDPSGFTRIQFAIDGFPLDVAAFFDTLHARGVAAAAASTTEPCDPPRRPFGTLAHLLDTRSVKVGEPGPESLPQTINPLGFLVANVLRNNVIAVRIKTSGLGPRQLGLHNLRYLGRIVPPGVALLLIITVTLPGESVTVGESQETLSPFVGCGTESAAIAGARLAESLSMRVVGGRCL